MRRRALFLVAALTALLCAADSFAGAAQEGQVLDPDGVQALARAGAAVNVHPATGAARFVRLAAASPAEFGPGATPQAQIEAFLAARTSPGRPSRRDSSSTAIASTS